MSAPRCRTGNSCLAAPKSRNAGRRRVTIPKRLRIYFRFDRRLLGDLCRAAARTLITVYRAASGRPDAVPGMVGAIQLVRVQPITARPVLGIVAGTPGTLTLSWGAAAAGFVLESSAA